MGAACVSQTQPDQDPKMNMDPCQHHRNRHHHAYASKQDLLPTSPIALLFEAMSHEIGYDASALQSYCAKLQSLWIYRVIDVVNMDESTWSELAIPSVIEHLIRDYVEQLSQSAAFRAYAQRSQTDIYVTFINKDIRTLLQQLLRSVDELQSAQQHIGYLTHVLESQYLCNIDKLQKYMSSEEWQRLEVPHNLKAIIRDKINLQFDADVDREPVAEAHIQMDDQAQSVAVSGSGADEEGSGGGTGSQSHSPSMSSADRAGKLEQMDEDKKESEEVEVHDGTATVMVTGLHSMSRRITRKFQEHVNRVRANDDSGDDDEKYLIDDDDTALLSNNNLHGFDDKLCGHKYKQYKGVSVSMSMSELAAYFAAQLFVHDMDAMYAHFQFFADYGYSTLYHLSFISDELYDKLLLITSTPHALKCELYDLLTAVRGKYSTLNANCVRAILPFSSNLYWEKSTSDALAMLQQDTQLDLSDECDALMSNFYSNIWDWQFVSDRVLQQMRGYQRYEIVRIRMQHIIKLCQFQYGEHNIPMLPAVWNSQFNGNLLLHQILPISEADKLQINKYGRNSLLRSFHFDGLDWNESTRQSVSALLQYLDANFVRKLQFLPIQHRKNKQEWREMCSQFGIAPHLRFKVNFFAIQGLPNSDDEWLNAYIQQNYKKVLPQFQQSVNTDIIIAKQKRVFLDVQSKVECIERMLYFINAFNEVDIEGDQHGFDDDEHADEESKMKAQQIVEMNDMIQATIKEIDDLGLNEQFYEIIQLCGSQRLAQLKRGALALLMQQHVSYPHGQPAFDEAGCKQLNEINRILHEMTCKVYAIPIDDIVQLSKTVTHSVQWLTQQLHQERNAPSMDVRYG